MAWDKGTHLQGGRYVIEKELGRGGSGITYLASRTDNGQSVAIKTVNKMVQDSIDFDKCQQEFENEARRLQQCTHPHIVSVHDLFLEGLLCCMVMEYISGETLASYVDKQGVLSETEALHLHYIRQIGEALIEVHKNGLLHRDVKPRNIMLRSNSSEAVLIDFGAAREFTHNHTQTHTRLVSDGFAPLEQYIKKRKRGAYTDVYATAATLYFMVTKKVPPTALDRADGERLVPPKQLNWRISDRVNEAIVKGMALEPSDRPQSMQEWLKLLEPPEVITPPTVEPAHKVEVIRPPSLPVPTPHPSEPDTSLRIPQPSEPDTRSTRIIPWESLIIVFIAYVVTGLLLAYRSAPLWVLAASGSVAMVVAGGGAVVVMTWAVTVARAVAEAVVVAVAMAVAVAGAVAGAVTVVVAVAMAVAVAKDVDGAVAGAVAVAVAGAVAGAVTVTPTRKRLLESFSRFHTFLILAATSELSLGLGWLVYPMIFPKR